MTVYPAPDLEAITAEMAQPWLLKAACAGQSRLLTDPAREEQAKDLCVLQCPVKHQCAAHVFSLPDHLDPGGVIAGWTEKRRMREKQRRRVRAAIQRKKEAEQARLEALSISELVAEVVAVLAEETEIPATRRRLRPVRSAGHDTNRSQIARCEPQRQREAA